VIATRVPDAIEPIRAWRVWRSSTEADGSLVLQSLTHAGGSTRWPPGETLQAGCAVKAHQAPNSACTCGIYAHKTREAAIAQAAGAPGAVVGEVELWGAVVEHEHGYRAQWARPDALWIPLVLNPHGTTAHEVTAALSRQAALRGYGDGVGLYHPHTGLVVDLADLRSVFLREPAPETPLRELLPGIAWSCLRVGLIVSSALVAALASMLTFVAVGLLGLLLPLVAAGAAAGLVGPGVLRVGLGALAGLAVVAAYVAGAVKLELFDKADSL
jgi:hypothetical protein